MDALTGDQAQMQIKSQQIVLEKKIEMETENNISKARIYVPGCATTCCTNWQL